MNLHLRGKRALITGATRGIGRQIARELAREGADVAVCARAIEDVEDVVRELKTFDVKAVGAACNIKNAEEYKAWVDQSAEQLGGVDIFIANVSAGAGYDSEKNWWKSFEVDVLGSVRGCESVIPHMEKAGGGSIVMISSTNAVEVFSAPMAYNAMKAALITYAKQLSQFVGNKNIRVNSVCPGPIYFEGGAWEMIKDVNRPFYDSTIRKIPRGEMGTLEEIASVVTFVASPRASLITGSNIVADAGFTKRVQF